LVIILAYFSRNKVERSHSTDFNIVVSTSLVWSSLAYITRCQCYEAFTSPFYEIS